MRAFAFICLLSLAGTVARAHDPYEITSVLYVRSNVIELFVEMEFPAGMKLAGVEPVQGVAALTQFEQAQSQLATLAGGFFDFTAGNNRVAALTTNVSLGVEDHIQFKVEYAATPLRPLQFTARGLRGVSDSPYGTSLTVLDMVNQKVLGQTTLFALSPRADFPPQAPETIPSQAAIEPQVSTTNSATQAPIAQPPTNPIALTSIPSRSEPRKNLALMCGLITTVTLIALFLLRKRR